MTDAHPSEICEERPTPSWNRAFELVLTRLASPKPSHSDSDTHLGGDRLPGTGRGPRSFGRLPDPFPQRGLGQVQILSYLSYLAYAANLTDQPDGVSLLFGDEVAEPNKVPWRTSLPISGKLGCPKNPGKVSSRSLSVQIPCPLTAHPVGAF